MIKEPGYYWAYDDEERPQLIEILGNGTCLVPGVAGPVRENSFVHICLDRIEPVLFSTASKDCYTCFHVDQKTEMCGHPSGSSCTAGIRDKWREMKTA